MSLSKNISFNMYREVLLLNSFVMERAVFLIREKFDIFQPIDLESNLDFRIPILPGGIVSNALSVEGSLEIRELSIKLGITHKSLIRYVLNGETPRFETDKFTNNILEDRLIPIYSNSTLSYGIYIRVDDELSDSALKELKKLAKAWYPDIYGKSKRMQPIKEEKHKVYYEINQIMKKLLRAMHSTNKPTLSDQDTTIFNAALREYVDNHFEENDLNDEDDVLYKKTLEKFRQYFIKTEEAYQIPNLKKMARLLVDTTHKP